MFGQLNPMKTVAPQRTVNTGALANLMGQQNQAFDNVGKQITNVGNVAEAFGRDVNTNALNDLIASGQLEGKSESEIQNLIAQEAGGLRQNVEGAKAIQDIQAGARTNEMAKQQQTFELAKQAKDQLFELNKMSKEQLFESGMWKQKAQLEELLKDKEIAGAMNRLVTQNQFDVSNKVGENIDKRDEQKRLFEQQEKIAKIETDSRERIAKLTLGTKTNPTGLEKDGIKKIMEMENPVERQTEMIETVLEDKNIFQDAKFDEPTELLVKGAVQKAMETSEGQSAFATGDRDVIMGVVKKYIPKGEFKSVASGFGAVNPFGRHFLDTNKQTFVQGE